MAWAGTKTIGCGVASCPNGQWKTYVVCIYWPKYFLYWKNKNTYSMEKFTFRGNYLSQKIYDAGSVCGGCNVQNGQLKCQYGLCVS